MFPSPSKSVYVYGENGNVGKNPRKHLHFRISWRAAWQGQLKWGSPGVERKGEPWCPGARMQSDEQKSTISATRHRNRRAMQMRNHLICWQEVARRPSPEHFRGMWVQKPAGGDLRGSVCDEARMRIIQELCVRGKKAKQKENEQGLLFWEWELGYVWIPMRRSQSWGRGSGFQTYHCVFFIYSLKNLLEY
jgi:hypothetical protein